MDEISNRALAVLLVAAIIISLGGTMISLNKIGQLPIGAPISQITGLASTDTGLVNLTVASGISITTADSEKIDFGSCTPQAGNVSIVNSEKTEKTSLVCPSATAPTNITIRNNGNVNVNVTMIPTDVGEVSSGSFIDSSSGLSYIAYKVFNGYANGYANGCFNNSIIGTNSSSWNKYTNLTSTSSKQTICANLTSNVTANSVGVFIQLGLPYDAVTGSDNLTFSFSAELTD